MAKISAYMLSSFSILTGRRYATTVNTCGVCSGKAAHTYKMTKRRQSSEKVDFSVSFSFREIVSVCECHLQEKWREKARKVARREREIEKSLAFSQPLHLLLLLKVAAVPTFVITLTAKKTVAVVLTSTCVTNHHDDNNVGKKKKKKRTNNNIVKKKKRYWVFY